MSDSKRVDTRKTRLTVTVKVAALIAALGFVTIVLEQPRLTAAPSNSAASVAQSLHSTDSGVPMTSSTSESAASGESRLPAAASQYVPAYFPGQFAAPKGDSEPLPMGF